jgi:hypothetical protein
MQIHAWQKAVPDCKSHNSRGNVASLFLNGSNASAHEIADGDAILILRTN